MVTILRLTAKSATFREPRQQSSQAVDLGARFSRAAPIDCFCRNGHGLNRCPLSFDGCGYQLYCNALVTKVQEHRRHEKPPRMAVWMINIVEIGESL